MYNANTGKRERRAALRGPAWLLDFCWPMFFWVDMLRNLLKMYLELYREMIRHPFTSMPSTVLTFLAIFYPFGYGIYIVAQATNWEPRPWFDGDPETDFHVFVFLARSFGKLCTLCNLVGVLFVTKTMSTMWDTIPHDKRPVGWRKLHIWLCQAMFLFGVAHGISHVWRVKFADNTRNANITFYRALGLDWEIYEQITGGFLILALLTMNLPYAFLRSKFWTKEHGLFFKTWFRYTHRPVFIMFEVVYLLHCSSFSPVVLILFWFFSLHSYKLAIQRFGFRFLYKSKAHNNDFISNKVIPAKQRQYVLELKVTFHEEIPMKYGYYCYVKMGSCGASYTMIPMDSNTALFRIQRCALTESIKTRLGKLSYMRAGSVYASPSSQLPPLECYGPYLSGDYNTGNSKKVAVLVSGTGNAVSDALALFNSARRQYWKSLSILNAGSKQLDDQYYKIQGIPCVAVPDRVTINGQLQLNYYAAKVRQPFVNLINVNSLNVTIVRRLLLALQSCNYSIVICSAMWRGIVDQVLEQDNELAAKAEMGRDADTINPNIIHIEDFEIA